MRIAGRNNAAVKWNLVPMNRTKRNYIFYVLMMAAAVLLGFWIIHTGNRLGTEGAVAGSVVAAPSDSAFDLFRQSLMSSLEASVALLLLQLIAILVAVRIFSFIFKYLGQPGVIGEIVAGIVLGPSVLGYFFPEAFDFLFAPHSLMSLNIISQLGLILFMFVIGMELDLDIIRKKGSETLVISHASIVFPFLLGLGLAYFVYPEFGEGAFLPFALFIGISVSITAFPVLARIVQERNLNKTQMGMLAIASAANNDITAWCLLAVIIAITKAGDVMSSLYTLLLTAIYIAFMVGLVRPFLKKLGEIYNNQEIINKTFVAFIFLVLILSSYITEVLGIHALFGAFLAGVIMPVNINFRRVITEKVEDVALVLFLPLFFVFTGLRTEIGTLNTPHLWGVCALFIVVSIAGKLLGAALSARFVGESWKDSLSIGVLMNTRGLMELIVLNIGYEMGVIPAPLFVIFVIMALFTTFMATPLLALIEKLFAPKKKKEHDTAPVQKKTKVLISFGNPANAPVLLDMAYFLCKRNIRKVHVTAVHYTIGADTNPMNVDTYSSESFTMLNERAQQLGIEVETRYKVTDRYIREVKKLVDEEYFDFVLLGGGPNFIGDYTATQPSLITTSYTPFPALVNDKIRTLFGVLRTTLGVFVNRNLETDISRVGIIVPEGISGSVFDFIFSIDTKVAVDLFRDNASEREFSDFVGDKQLVVINYESWLRITSDTPRLIASLPSFIVIKSGREVRPE